MHFPTVACLGLNNSTAKKCYSILLVFLISCKSFLKYCTGNLSHIFKNMVGRFFNLHSNSPRNSTLPSQPVCVCVYVQYTVALKSLMYEHPTTPLYFILWFNALKESDTPTHTHRFICEIFYWQTGILLFSVLFSRHF